MLAAKSLRALSSSTTSAKQAPSQQRFDDTDFTWKSLWDIFCLLICELFSLFPSFSAVRPFVG